MAPEEERVGFAGPSSARTIVVTGSVDHVREVMAALEQSGGVDPGDILTFTDLSMLEGACAALAPKSVRAYVQLPVSVASDAPTVTGRFRDFLTGGIVARFDAAATVLPTLADDAVVVLVGGNTPAAGTPADDQHARASLLRVLRFGLLADKPQPAFRVVSSPAGASANHITALALSGPPRREQRIAALDAEEPNMSYDDWRLAVLSLASVEA